MSKILFLFTNMKRKNVNAYCLKFERTEYGKFIRKQYESGQIKERRNNMRKLTVRQDGVANTLTTVLKDNYILIQQEE